MNFTIFRFNNYQETLRKKKLAFDYIMFIHNMNTAIHNHAFKNDKTVNKTNLNRNLQIPHDYKH
jgi:type IV secretory pathway VirD2 relaxase